MKNNLIKTIFEKTVQAFPKISIGFNLLILISVIAAFDIIKIFDVYFSDYFWAFLTDTFVVLTVLSLVYLVIQFKTIRWKAFMPLVLYILTFWIVSNTSYFETAWNARIKYELPLNKSRYEEIITKFENQELEPANEDGYVRLSPKPRDFILVNKSHNITSVFFDIGAGFHDYAGFMYRSDDSAPPSTMFMGAYWLSCKHQELYWYYCISY